ncbi:hypothetical protein BH20ACI4_BH20ACI4_03510 [soil metagenome]
MKKKYEIEKPDNINDNHPNIFICYRREDSPGHVGRLYDNLVANFKEDQIFIDIENLNPGDDFTQVIKDTVRSCNILLAVIGKYWLVTENINRLKDQNDLVRIEISTALNQNTRVIPILVHGATMPKQEELPENLIKLIRLQSVRLNDISWKVDLTSLIEFMKKIIGEQKKLEINKEINMIGKKVFVSYDHSEDVDYKRLLQAWDANTSFDFDFDSRGPNVPIDSYDASVIKGVLTAKMKSADYLLVIVGEKTHTSKWVRWEIGRARESDVKLKLAAVKIKSYYTLLEGLAGASVSQNFTLEGIVNALNAATNYY